MRILLTGCNGQVGRSLLPRLGGLGSITAVDRKDADFADPEALRTCLDSARPDLIVNAAACTDVDGAESDRKAAYAINADAPALLAAWAARAGAALVHYSTDYVFDGAGSRPWSERDDPAPINVYGASKLAGDAAVLQSGAPALVLRTSWVYAATGSNFLRTMLRLGREREELAVVDDQIGAPTPAPLLAEITTTILRQAAGDVAGFLRQSGGLVNAAASGETSWHGFAETVFDAARRRGAEFCVKTVRAVPSARFSRPARRPLNSRLDLARLGNQFSIRPPHWRDALERVMAELRDELR